MGDSDGSLVGQLLGPVAGLPEGAADGLLDGRSLGQLRETTDALGRRIQIQRTSLFDCFAFQKNEIPIHVIKIVAFGSCPKC